MEIKEIFNPNLLKGKVTIVTGAGRGLGRVLAVSLAKAGSDLVLVARHQEEIEKTSNEIRSAGVRTLAISADVRQSSDVLKMVQMTLAEFGKIDVLVNNAGLNASYVHHRFEDIPEKEWIEMIDTNINGVFLVTQAVGRIMIERRSGKIINISSALAVRAAPERICYSVTKAAVIQMTRALAAEWAQFCIKVNCIAPGSLDLYPGSTEESYLKLNEERKKRIPLGRLGRLEEIGPLLVYLASEASDYITGETIFIDGGLAVGY